MVKLQDKAKLTKAGTVGVKGKFAMKTAQNRAFRTRHGLTYSGSSSSNAPTSVVLRAFEQASFRDILLLSAKQAKNLLFERNVLARQRRSDEVFHCWGCGAKMVRQADQSLRCAASSSACHIRGRISDAQLAYTPWANCAQTQAAPNWQLFLQTAYCLGVRMSNDQAAHMCKSTGETIRASYEKVLRCYTAHKIALAFAETTLAQQTVFQDEVVETDTARSAGRKEKKVRHHCGRTLVLKGRDSKKWTLHALNKNTSKGKRGSAPETAHEVRKPLQKSLGRGVVVAADGAKSWPGATKKPILKGVSHGRKLFTPTAKVPKKSLDARETKTLQRHAKAKAGAGKMVAEYQNHYAVPAGDNSAEGCFGNLKNTLRRIGGSGKGRKDHRRTIDALASSALLRQPGLEAILKAHVQYRCAGRSGKLKLSPKKFYEPTQCAWLFPSDP